MIALTQERKIALIEHADEIKDRLSEYGYPFQPHKTKQLLDIALASLTAEATAYIMGDESIDDFDRGYEFFAVRDKEGEEELNFLGLFTAPPVPEIKLPHELMNLVKSVEFYHSVKAENPDTETGMWRDANDWIKKAAVEAAPVIKRLNGLGE